MQNTAASLFTSSTKGCHLHLIFWSFPVRWKVIYSYGKYLQSPAKVLNECTLLSSLAPIHRNWTKRQKMKGEKQRCEVNSKASDKAQLPWVRPEGLYQHHTPWPCESKDSLDCVPYWGIDLFLCSILPLFAPRWPLPIPHLKTSSVLMSLKPSSLYPISFYKVSFLSSLTARSFRRYC